MKVLTVALVVASALALGAPASAAQEPEPEPESVSRLLIVSLPGLTWQEVKDHDLPVIEELFGDAALADLAPRSVSARSSPGAAYLTISAGTRTTSRSDVDGQQVAVDELVVGSPAGEIFERRTGRDAGDGAVSLGWPSLVGANAAEPFDAELGLLSDTLSDADLGMAVIGNADGTDEASPSFERQVGLAASSGDGRIAAGELDKDLLTDDPASPFGLRLDADVVVERFRDAWRAPAGHDGGVVLVEASDLARTMRYRDRVESERYDELRARALADSDELAGQLLAEVDPSRDAVMLLAPYNLPGDRDLTVAALQAPGQEPGYLQSASTQRARFLTLVDVAPTVLDLLGVERPASMEGRPFEVSPSQDSLEVRVDDLVSANEASRYRERLLFPTTLLLIIALALVTAAAAVAVVRDVSPRARRIVTTAALATVAVLPLSYVARGFPLEELGIAFYWAFIVVGAALVAWVATAAAGRLGRPRAGLVAVLGLVLLVLAIDAISGSRLSLGAAFGYSAAGNSRLYGVSNYAFGQIAAVSFLLASLVAAVSGRRWARLAAIGLLVAVLVLVGMPVWGANVGGSLALTPTIGLFALLILGRRVRLRSIVAGGVATMAAIVAFGLVDLARPPGQRAHLGRLFERIGDEGFGPLLSIVERKFLASVSVFGSSFWVAAIPIGVAFIVFLARYPTRPLDRLRERIPTLGTGLVAAGVAAVLGTIANDSGPLVAGVLLLVVAAALVALALEPEPARRPDVAPGRVASASQPAPDGGGGRDGPAAEERQHPVGAPT